MRPPSREAFDRTIPDYISHVGFNLRQSSASQTSQFLRGEDSIAELCRREGIAQSMYYVWSKEFLEAGKRRLAGDTARAATTDEVKDFRKEATALKEVVADQALEIRLLKKAFWRMGKTANEIPRF